MHAPAHPGLTHVVAGNRLTLLPDGPERLDALIALIDGARRSLRILYYIYAPDASGQRVNAALIAAAGRGVKVTLIIDGFGSDTAKEEFFAPVEAAGVAMCRFEPRFGRRYLLRNHQKLALADAEDECPRIIVGGFNVENDYFGTGADSWRDLGLLLEGEDAQRMGGYFDALDTWIKTPKGRLRDLNRALARWSETEGVLRWLIGGPTRHLSPWAQTVRDDMRAAKRIDIIAGYFTPSPTMLRRLDHAGKLGHNVRVLTAAKSDNNATISAARFTYAGLLRKQVQVFEYTASKLHTKLYVVDDTVHIGSANFDMRSLFINLELMLRIEDAAFADHVREYFAGELSRAEAITPALYKERTTWWRRLKQFASYLAVGVLDPLLSRGLNG